MTCRDVSPMFAAAVEYLGTNKNIWKKCCREEIVQEMSTLDIISKRHPHSEGLNHPKNWKQIYESWFSVKFIPKFEQMNFTGLRVGKENSQICDILTHGDLILVLVKYNKDFSIFYRILTINKDGDQVDKSCRFYDDSLYVTPIQNSAKVRSDAILLYCESCKLMAFPVTTNHAASSCYPKFCMNSNMLMAEHSNGDVFWFNNSSGIFEKGDCVNISDAGSDVKEKIFMNISCRYSSIYIACEEIHREFNTSLSLNSKVTCAKFYAQLILLGTDTGMLYAYHCADKKDIIALNLKHYLWRYNVSGDPLLAIDIAELKNYFGIICCSSKTVYRIFIERLFF